jgi:hypothetical protein
VTFLVGKTKKWENDMKRNMKHIRVKMDSAGKYSSREDITSALSVFPVRMSLNEFQDFAT